VKRRGDDATPAFEVRVDTVGNEFLHGSLPLGSEEAVPRHGVIDEEKPATFRGIAVDLLIRVLIAPVGGLALGFAEGGIHDLENHFAGGEGGGDAAMADSVKRARTKGTKVVTASVITSDPVEAVATYALLNLLLTPFSMIFG
jgi:hypothetical protein